MFHLRNALAVVTVIALSHAVAACSVEAEVRPDSLATVESSIETKQQITSDQSGNFYVLTTTGDLLWYRETSPSTGVRGWVRGTGNRIGIGWNDTVKLIAGGDGTLYRIKSNGELLWYRDLVTDGNVAWSGDSGARVIGWGWNGFTHVFSGGGGNLYAVKPNGDVIWYKHGATGRMTGTADWEAGWGEQIDTGWDDVKFAFTCQDENLYAVRENGELLWYRREAQDMTQRWKRYSGRVIGTGWQNFSHVWCGGKGNVYAVTATGDLRHYRDIKQNGDANPWSSDSGATIGNGWKDMQPCFSGALVVTHPAAPS